MFNIFNSDNLWAASKKNVAAVPESHLQPLASVHTCCCMRLIPCLVLVLVLFTLKVFLIQCGVVIQAPLRNINAEVCKAYSLMNIGHP